MSRVEADVRGFSRAAPENLLLWRVLAGLVTAAAVCGAVELLARLAGVADFPLYQADSQVGYIPAPNQHGRFLNKNDWVFNERSMGVGRPFQPSADGVLLVGDSLVYGGNPLRQADRLGPRLEQDLHRPVWPIAAGSWALQNELREIELNPDFKQLGAIVVVSNSADFGAPSVWRSEATHPRHRPASAAIYAVQRKYLHPEDPADAPWTPQAEAVWRASLERFFASYPGRIVWVLYPTKTELGHTAPIFSHLTSVIAGRARVIDLNTAPGWRADDYRDNIHPTAGGDRVFAEILAHALATP